MGKHSAEEVTKMLLRVHLSKVYVVVTANQDLGVGIAEVV